MARSNEWLSTEQGDTLADDLGFLLHDLIAGWGFSVWELGGRDLVRNGNGIVTGDAVARAVIEAEGDDAQSRPRDFRAIGRLFHYRYGAHAVAAADYAPGAYLPYSGVPLPDVADAAEPDAIVRLARQFQADADQRKFPLDALDPGDIVRHLRNLRSGYRLGAEEEQTAREMRALILLHERVTGQPWD